MNHIIAFRHELHQNPELSNHEFETSARIRSFMEKLHPDETISLGKTGVAFVFSSKNEGITTMFRAELDALAIQENNTFSHKSRNSNMHACGHDGHMAIIAALGEKVAMQRPKKGRTILLFQPAEEIEQGARDIINNKNFKAIEPDFIFALHNIPGAPKHQILLKEGSFAAASKGMTVKLTGKTAHAAEPENGISPANAISKIIADLHELRDHKTLFSDLAMLTIIHIQLGEISFGISPGYAEIRITLRAFENSDMNLLTQKCEEIIQKTAHTEHLNFDITYNEVFPATINNKSCIEIIQRAAKMNNLNIKWLDRPFKWSEDFAYYTEKYKGGYFGLGAGEQQTPLHNSEYDFPDDIIETGLATLFSIYFQCHF